MPAIRGLIHGAVLRTRHVPVLESIYRCAYHAAMARASQAFPGVRSIVLHRGMTSEGWEPGVSDIDLLLVLGTPEFSGLGHAVQRLRAVFPMIGDIWLGDQHEVRRYLQRGGLRAWEDLPGWRTLKGETLEWGAPLRESPEKKRWLDPWTWAFVSHMELCRRLFLPGRDLPEKRQADMRKLFADVCRLTEPAERLAARAQALAAVPKDMTDKALWLESCRRLSTASRRVLEAVGSESRPGPRLPAGGGLEGELLRVSSEARAAVTDLPYHHYVIVGEETSEREYARIADRLLELRPRLSGVPMVLPPSTWSLALQSSYLGGPLGWDGPAGGEETGGLFSGWRACALGEQPSVRLLPEGLRRELDAEAASWMVLWWRGLWLDPAWSNRFALFHLYTRAIALRLRLAGAQSGPFNDLPGLLRRAEQRFPEERELWADLRRFTLEEPPEAVDELPRSSLAPEHETALSRIMGGIGDLL